MAATKLTEGMIAVAADRVSGGERQCDVARDLGVSRPALCRALKGRVRERSDQEEARVRILRSITVGDDGCWEWTKLRSLDGYGRVTFRTKNMAAHRLAFWAFQGDDPGERLVCHRCDNPACVNPGHLFLGTAQDNSADMVKKGRSLSAGTNPRARLTEDDVRAIRNRAKERAYDLAREFRVSPGTIYFVRSGRTWKEVD